ncbi:hypothetical protein [Tsukamurella sp. 1534]|uniref:hypothetical protein n=1 Tax=Tsukamurella sp. 1534 TaxID=1151061 RepID=UPI0005936A73|nr:hypothetical protein [Tsukamurella sp. 1534]
MDVGAVFTIAYAFGSALIPIALLVVVRRRQKRGEWSGGFTPHFRKWTLGEEDEWRYVPPPAHHIGSSEHRPPPEGWR